MISSPQVTHDLPKIASRTPDTIDASVFYYAHHPEQIDRRLKQLDREWDAAQALIVGACGMSLAALALATIRRRPWPLLPIAAANVFLAHRAIQRNQGIPLVGSLRVRPRKEIEAERYALKAVRGDFATLPPTAEARGTAPVLEAVRQ